MAVNWDIIDKVVYINLKQRVDRKEHIKKQLKLLNVPSEKIFRFEARKHLLGHIGCAQSHLAVLDLALERGWGNILVLEDDMCFNHTAETYEALNFTFNTLKTLNWDATLLSANYYRVIPFKSTQQLVKPLQALCTCAYVVNANYLSQLRANFAEATERLLQGGARSRYAIDVHWISAMQRGRWLGMHPVAGHQMADQSDIEHEFTDYQHCFYKPIDEIAVGATS